MLENSCITFDIESSFPFEGEHRVRPYEILWLLERLRDLQKADVSRRPSSTRFLEIQNSRPGRCSLLTSDRLKQNT
jgi:hypothetical protein